MRKKVLILTLNDYILYQPSILNLYDFLSANADVTVVSLEPIFITKQKEEKRNIRYIKPRKLAISFYTKVDFIISKLTPLIKKIKPGFTHHFVFYNHYLPLLFENFIKNEKLQADVVIAVDIPVLSIAQKYYGPVHFLSLEIENNDNPNYRKIDTGKIKSVFIQSEMRCDYLFPGLKLKKFIVQNSPVYKKINAEQKVRRDFVWAGTVTRRFAILECIEFFDRYPEYTLLLKGGGDPKTKRIIQERYKHLLDAGRIAFNSEYLDANAFISFLSSFKIGFCFYAWNLIDSSFNYQSAPSGKVFMYLAAGTPVIACNIPGFHFVKEFGAGVLIDDYAPSTIKKAVEQIEADYEAYSAACYKAAEYFSFDNHVQPYIDFLLKDEDS